MFRNMTENLLHNALQWGVGGDLGQCLQLMISFNLRKESPCSQLICRWTVWILFPTFIMRNWTDYGGCGSRRAQRTTEYFGSLKQPAATGDKLILTCQQLADLAMEPDKANIRTRARHMMRLCAVVKV